MKIVPGAFVLLAYLFAPVAAIPQPADLIGLRLIVLKTEAEAAAVLARMQAGEKFEDLARAHSVDSTASAGGYLGTFTIGQLRQELQTSRRVIVPLLERLDRDGVTRRVGDKRTLGSLQ